MTGVKHREKRQGDEMGSGSVVTLDMCGGEQQHHGQGWPFVMSLNYLL